MKNEQPKLTPEQLAHNEKVVYSFVDLHIDGFSRLLKAQIHRLMLVEEQFTRQNFIQESKRFYQASLDAFYEGEFEKAYQYDCASVCLRHLASKCF